MPTCKSFAPVLVFTLDFENDFHPTVREEELQVVSGCALGYWVRSIQPSRFT